jgi:hypothetical protein
MVLPPAQHHRPGPDVLTSLYTSCRGLLHDRAAFDDRYLRALGELLPAGHPVHEARGTALELLDVVLRALLEGESPERVEKACRACGERCATAGLPDDVYPAVGRAVAWAARDVAGGAWSASMSSGWVALHLWVVGEFEAGASRVRMRGEVWGSFPEFAPPESPSLGSAPPATAIPEFAPAQTPSLGSVSSGFASAEPADAQGGSGAAQVWALLERLAQPTPPHPRLGDGAPGGPSGAKRVRPALTRDRRALRARRRSAETGERLDPGAGEADS